MNIKSEILKFRVTPEEEKIIESKIKKSKLSRSQYFRQCTLQKDIIVMDGAEEVAKELRAIGNNLNQIARAINCRFVTAVDFKELVEEVDKVWQLLNSLQHTVQ